MDRIKELIEQLNKLNYAYYTLDNPLVSDKEYDKLYNELLLLEKETGITLPNSPTQKVGDTVLDGFKKVNHKNKLWSLDKRQNLDDIKQWIKDCESFVNNYNKTHSSKLPIPQYVVTKKYDGLTLKIDYDTKSMQQGSTRGTGVIGECVTEQCKTIITLPKEIKEDKLVASISVHGEGLMSKKALREYNDKHADGIKVKVLKNCRNGIAGAIRTLNTKETAKRKPMIIFYNINDMSSIYISQETYVQQLEYMKYRGLPVTEYVLCNTYEEVEKAINDIEYNRDALPYDIDGAVIAINDLKTREAMGYTIKFPKFSMAYKYEAEETTSKLIDIEWRVGRTGKITPRATIEPIDLCGTTVAHATLNNINDITKKGLKLNADIFIRKANDVIPEITGVVEESIDSNCIDIKVPKTCPICGEPTYFEGELLYCYNESCESRIVKSVSHYCSREAMNINGLSEKTIEKLHQMGIINKLIDLYYLDNYKDEIINMEGMGVKSYNKLIASINKSRECKLENFIYALGIPNVGKSTAKNMVKYIGEYNPALTPLLNIEVCSYDRWLQMKDCGEVLAKSIVDYFKNDDLNDQYYVLSEELTFIEDKPQETNSVSLDGKVFVITGSVEIFKNRNEVKDKIESLGGKVTGSVSAKTDYLINNDVESSTGKNKKAKELNIPIISEQDFINMIK